MSALMQFVPSLAVALQAAGTALLFGVGGAAGVSALRGRGVRVAYTRKVFHFVIFTTAAGVHAVLALPGTLVFGSVVAVIVLAAVVAGDGNPFYEALARDKDRPRRSLFIVVPLITTAVGGARLGAPGRTVRGRGLPGLRVG